MSRALALNIDCDVTKPLRTGYITDCLRHSQSKVCAWPPSSFAFATMVRYTCYTHVYTYKLCMPQQVCIPAAAWQVLEQTVLHTF